MNTYIIEGIKYAAVRDLGRALEMDEKKIHNTGCKAGRMIKANELVDRVDYISITAKKQMAEYGIKMDGPFQHINILSKSGCEKLFGYEVKRGNVNQKNLDKVIVEVYSGEECVDGGSGEDVNAGAGDGVQDAVREDISDVHVSETVGSLIGRYIGGLIDGVVDDICGRTVNRLMPSVEGIIKEMVESEVKEVWMRFEEAKAKELAMTAENNANIIKFSGKDFEAKKPANIADLRDRKDIFYQKVDSALAFNAEFKRRNQVLDHLYGKLHRVYGIVWTQLRREVISDYDNAHYSKVDMICLSDKVFAISCNILDSLSHESSLNKVASSGMAVAKRG